MSQKLDDAIAEIADYAVQFHDITGFETDAKSTNQTKNKAKSTIEQDAEPVKVQFYDDEDPQHAVISTIDALRLIQLDFDHQQPDQLSIMEE